MSKAMRRYPQPDLLRDYRWAHGISSIRRNSPVLWTVLLALLTTFVFLRWSGLAITTLMIIILLPAVGIGWEGWSKRRARRLARKAKRNEMMRESRVRFGLR
jgi:hypothetical protein